MLIVDEYSGEAWKKVVALAAKDHVKEQRKRYIHKGNMAHILPHHCLLLASFVFALVSLHVPIVLERPDISKILLPSARECKRTFVHCQAPVSVHDSQQSPAYQLCAVTGLFAMLRVSLT